MPISVPKFITRAWASLGSKFDIPENADPLTGKAGYSQGFGPVNLTPVEAGGIPPWGQDMNGILFDLSSAIQYQQAGRSFPFNQAFANAIGGYGKGAFVTGPSDQSLLYQSTIDSNTVAPPSAGWQRFSISQATEAIAGIAKIATTVLSQGGVNDDSFITPKKLADVLALRIGHVFQQNDWAPLPGGLILQWGKITSTPTNETPVVFPMAFPNLLLTALVTDLYLAGSPSTSIGTLAIATNYTKSGMTVGAQTAGTAGVVFWVAIGY